MKHKQPKRLFWERYLQEGTNRHRPAVDSLKKIIQNKKKIRQAIGAEITQHDFTLIEKLSAAMADLNGRFWRQMMDNEANEYLNSLAILETIIENKKKVISNVLESSSPDQVAHIIKMTELMRLELKEAAWISARTIKSFKRALCDVMINGIQSIASGQKENPKKNKKSKKIKPENLTFF